LKVKKRGRREIYQFFTSLEKDRKKKKKKEREAARTHLFLSFRGRGRKERKSFPSDQLHGGRKGKRK